MYNGRRRHIQTESTQDQSVKEESIHGHRNRVGGEEALWDTSRTKLPVTKTKHLAEREMYKEQNSVCSPRKEKKQNKNH